MKFFNVDLVIIIMVYLFVFYKETGAGIFAFGQGLLIDIFSNGILGLSTLLYLIIFFCIKIGSYPIDVFSVRGQIIIISLTVFLKEILYVTFLYLLPFKITFSPSAFFEFGASAICSGLIAPLLFYMFNRVTFMLTRISHEDG